MSYYKDYGHERAPFSVRIVKFGCDNCGRRWQSANGSLTDYQKCKRCYEKCYPRSYKIQAPNKRGNENRGSFQAHNTELCGRCERLGYSCMELGNGVEDETLIVAGADDEEIVLSKANDLASFMTVEPNKQKKQKKKDKVKKPDNETIKMETDVGTSIQFNMEKRTQNIASDIANENEKKNELDQAYSNKSSYDLMENTSEMIIENETFTEEEVNQLDEDEEVHDGEDSNSYNKHLKHKKKMFEAACLQICYFYDFDSNYY